jgi:hypothetical protein
MESIESLNKELYGWKGACATLYAALPDPDKLDWLAEWLDELDSMDDAPQGNGVQRDLRRWAKMARDAKQLMPDMADTIKELADMIAELREAKKI